MHMVAPTADLAELLAAYHPDVYQYHFIVPNSFHSVELNYVFGSPFSGRLADEMNYDQTLDMFNDTDRAYSALVMRLWTNFAKYR